MSWLFGMNKGQNIEAPQVPTFGEGSDNDKVTPPAGLGPPDGIGKDVEGYRSNPYSFDSTALERAAKAAKVSLKLTERNENLVKSQCLRIVAYSRSFHGKLCNLVFT